ncbi:glycerate kinase, partial [Salmonella enterica subsp. enterica serovar Kentucky]|nr:glycerate kinase [Salmonella enterica subsp. enterica serovar Kentucky]
MSSLSLITSGVAWFAAAAVLAFLFSFHKALSGWIAEIGRASGDGKTAFIEMAAASGLALVPPEKRNPLITTSRGTGELILQA